MWSEKMFTRVLNSKNWTKTTKNSQNRGWQEAFEQNSTKFNSIKFSGKVEEDWTTEKTRFIFMCLISLKLNVFTKI